MNERDMNVLDWRDNMITWLHDMSLVYRDKITMKRGFPRFEQYLKYIALSLNVKFSFTEILGNDKHYFWKPESMIDSLRENNSRRV